jgi:hypothetical protein
MAKYCMDCPHYREGGYCMIDGKPVSALKEACSLSDKGEKKPAPAKDTKICPKCRRLLTLDNFAFCRKGSDGRQVYCRECAREAYRRWANRRKAREQI